MDCGPRRRSHHCGSEPAGGSGNCDVLDFAVCTGHSSACRYQPDPGVPSYRESFPDSGLSHQQRQELGLWIFCSCGDSSVLLDLGRLNQIVDFSEELAYVTVEPGVTQGQLHEFLQARKSTLWLDATGAGPDCSLIGNVMERGFGHTPYGDHFAQVCGFEVVLPTGEMAQTGFARFPNSQAAAVYKWGVGLPWTVSFLSRT